MRCASLFRDPISVTITCHLRQPVMKISASRNVIHLTIPRHTPHITGIGGVVSSVLCGLMVVRWPRRFPCAGAFAFPRSTHATGCFPVTPRRADMAPMAGARDSPRTTRLRAVTGHRPRRIFRHSSSATADEQRLASAADLANNPGQPLRPMGRYPGTRCRARLVVTWPGRHG